MGEELKLAKRKALKTLEDDEEVRRMEELRLAREDLKRHQKSIYADHEKEVAKIKSKNKVAIEEINEDIKTTKKK
jgi:hypothetical protein